MPWFATTTRGANALPRDMARGVHAILEVRVRLAPSSPVLELGFSRRACRVIAHELSDQEGCHVKGSQKPKKLEKKPAQKTLKERRTAKRAAAKHASRSLDV